MQLAAVSRYPGDMLPTILLFGLKNGQFLNIAPLQSTIWVYDVVLQEFFV